MKHVKLFESFLNENLRDDKIGETYMWLRYKGNSDEKVLEFLLKECNLEPDSLYEIIERWLDDNDIKDKEAFISNPPEWFTEIDNELTKKFNENEQ